MSEYGLRSLSSCCAGRLREGEFIRIIPQYASVVQIHVVHKCLLQQAQYYQGRPLNYPIDIFSAFVLLAESTISKTHQYMAET